MSWPRRIEVPRMPKGSKKPPTAEEIAEMLGVAPEKTFKVDHESMGKVSAAAPWVCARASCRGRHSYHGRHVLHLANAHASA